MLVPWHGSLFRTICDHLFLCTVQSAEDKQANSQHSAGKHDVSLNNSSLSGADTSLEITTEIVHEEKEQEAKNKKEEKQGEGELNKPLITVYMK